jgi:hypothetical protein
MEKKVCPRCAEAKARMESALHERDEALLELARAREEINRLKLAEKWGREEEIPPYPLEAGTAWPVPLRYRVADAANSWLKGRAAPVQQFVRSLVRRSYGE